MALKNCKEFVVMDNHNIFYTNEHGVKIYDAQQKDTVVVVNTTHPFSDNLQEVIVPLGGNQKERNFWEYIKSDIASVAIISIFSLVMGIISYYEDVMFMTYFMSIVLILLWVGSFIDWKTKG